MELTRLLDGLHFAECPRWHEGKLWFSDIFDRRVMTVDESGNGEIVLQLGEEDLPAGLGFLPDGSLLIANLARPVILRLDPSGSVGVHAELSELANGPLNDMVVDSAGRAYVGASGTDDLDAPRPLKGTGSIICVEPDGAARIVAEEMDAPNGPCITSDDRQYIVASLPAAELTAFDRNPDGSLSNRRVWADLRPASADGIAVDAENGVWTCSPLTQEVRRVLEGGEITNVLPIADQIPLVPCLGGHDGRTLFILSAVGGVDKVRERTNTAVIDTVRVPVPAWHNGN